MFDRDELLPLAEAYAKSRGIGLVGQPLLGHGSDGAVWKTSRHTALKVAYKQQNFECELECYRRFQAAQTIQIAGFSVPTMEDHDEALRAIEMSMVDPPYLLDFGKVHLDVPPRYYGDEQLMRNAHAEWRDRFGKDWKQVAYVLSVLRDKYGIITWTHGPRTSACGTSTRTTTRPGAAARPPCRKVRTRATGDR